MVFNCRLKVLKTVWVLLGLLLFSSASAAQTNSLVVLFGDSITVGFNSGRRIDFPSGSTTISGPRQFLSDLLNDPAAPRNTIVANWGAGGTSSANGITRITSNLDASRANNPADQFIVLIMYGTNDFGQGISTSTTAFNNNILVFLARNVGYLPIVGTVTPRSDRDIGPLAAAITAEVTANNAQVVDQFSFFNARPLEQNFELEISLLSGQPIRLHPNDDGYRLLAQNWFDGALQNLIPVTFPPPPPAPPVLIAPLLPLLLED